LKLKDLRRKS